MKNKFVYFSISSVIMSALLVGGTAFAQTAQTNSFRGGQGRIGRAPGVFGTVATVSGTTLTVADSRSNTTYTVDASSSTVTKNNAASSLGNVSVGDTVMVQGTINGTAVVATAIRDGVMAGGPNKGGMIGNRPNKAQGVFGTVASINGTTLTITAKAQPNRGTAATYTVDASKATVTKNSASSSVSNIAVGDTIMVQGTVSSTSVTATSIRDGMAPGQKSKQNANPIIQGNGQPVIGGSITAINGTTLTVTNKSNVTYTVDASSAKIEKGNADSSLANVAVGDNVLIQGTVNGTAVTASSVIDQGAPRASSANPASSASNANRGFVGGLFGAVGGFFQRLFGFL
ncbi:MAG: DUF5666 domain-containing protein [Candidatus Parcubacteria bacterium]|nr:DUF5666 domain-containing protein [Candidatus Parcubacteria bacterium]